MKCQREYCRCRATHTIQAVVPARGLAWDQHTPLSIATGLRFCSAHAHRKDIELFSADSKKLMSDAIRAMGYADPDFSRAHLAPSLITDPEATQEAA